MKTEYQIRTAQTLSNSITAVSSVSHYVESKRLRTELASLFKQVINIGNGYPPKIISMSLNTATMLCKNVRDTCPNCVKKKDMIRYVELALRDLKTYNTKLVEWLGESFTQEEPKNIHELRPTDKN